MAEKMEKELLTYLENPDTIPNEVYRNVMRGQRLFAQIEHDLKQCRQEMKQTYNYIFNLVKNTRIIDGKALEAEMSALLIKYIADLIKGTRDHLHFGATPTTLARYHIICLCCHILRQITRANRTINCAWGLKTRTECTRR